MKKYFRLKLDGVARRSVMGASGCDTFALVLCNSTPDCQYERA